MAYTTNKTLNVRIKNKYDSYENWVASSVILEAGEIAIAHTLVDSGIKDDKGVDVKHPALLMKVGDGSSSFAALPWLSAKAADVADWAKAEAKPVYAATEITGIADYIADYVSTEMGIEVDTDTQYQIVANGTNGFKLQSKGKGESAWADVAGSAFTVDFSAVTDRLDAIEENIGDINFTEEFAKYELAGTGAEEAGKVSAALEAYKTANDAAVGANTGAIAAIKDGTTIDSFADVETALAGKQAAGDYATNAQAQAYANAKDEAIAAAKKAGDDAQDAVDALAGKVGTVADGKTVVGLIDEAKTAAVTAATDHVAGVTGRLDAIEDNIGDINFADEFAKYETIENVNAFKGEVAQYKTDNDARVKAIEDDYLKAADKKSLQDQIDLIMDNPNTESVKDSIAEFTAYIEEHGEIAEGFRTDINKNKEDIAAITGDYLKAADKTELSGLIGGLDTRLDTAEGEIDALQGAVATKAEQSALEALDERLPEGTVADYVAGQIAPVTESIETLDGSLAAIAKSGNVDDLVQTASTYIVFDCGTASTIV